MRRAKNLKSIIGFWAVTLGMVVIIAFCVVGTARSQTDIEIAELEAYYRELEREWLSQTKEGLAKLGYQNSGVTLTRVVDEEGQREYTFTIHHGKIDKLSENDRSLLASRLAEEICVAEGCSFFHEFLMYD
ncbi:MAG: hypothetical protein IJF07_01235 [Lachnospiraceae bacterium]|nr:hypothetical protein [Lachnospiraceae bacterium]